MALKYFFFIDHHDAPADLAPLLAKEVERHITEYGVSAFIAGMYGNFDHMAMRTVIAAKEKFPWVRLSLLLPYHPAKRKIEKPKGVDELYFPDGLEKTPRRYAIIKANQKTIAQSDFLITYVIHPGSNAIKFLEYASKLERSGRIVLFCAGEVNVL